MSSLNQNRKMHPIISIALIFVLSCVSSEAVILEASRGIIKPMSLSLDDRPCADLMENDLSVHSEKDFLCKKSSSKHPKSLDEYSNPKGDKRYKLKAHKHDLTIDSAKKDSYTDQQTEDFPRTKPSLDRWSDWHDMSVDPDLSSSETQQRRQSNSNVQPLYHNPYALVPFQVASPNFIMGAYPPSMPPVLHQIFPMTQYYHQPITRRVMMNSYQPASSRMLVPQRANLVSQRPLRPPQAPVSPSLIPAPTIVSNSTALRTQARVLKRRRIKTLLPVGLSSWLLGGIRDLDARHWRLPKDITDKLAINDVDLQHSEFNGPAIQPNTLPSINNQVQSGGSLERPDQPRPNVVPKISLPPR